jgi:hypothetical protein
MREIRWHLHRPEFSYYLTSNMPAPSLLITIPTSASAATTPPIDLRISSRAADHSAGSSPIFMLRVLETNDVSGAIQFAPYPLSGYGIVGQRVSINPFSLIPDVRHPCHELEMGRNI